jgi:hypothetical protein
MRAGKDGRGPMAAVRTTAIGLLVVLEACSSPRTSTPSAPVLPADALPGHPTAVRALTAEGLASDAIDPAAALSVLEGAGFLAGSARSFAVPGRRVRTVQTRVLRFSSTAGAGRYLAWLEANVRSIVGSGRFQDGAPLPSSGFVFVHEPGGCCPKEQPVALGVWCRGGVVLWVEAIGAVGEEDALRYADTFDAAI